MRAFDLFENSVTDYKGGVDGLGASIAGSSLDLIKFNSCSQIISREPANLKRFSDRIIKILIWLSHLM